MTWRLGLLLLLASLGSRLLFAVCLSEPAGRGGHCQGLALLRTSGFAVEAW